MTKDTIITAEGLKKIKDELSFRTTEKREQLRKSLEENRDAGDLSENEGYHLTIEETQLNEAKIQELEQILASAKVSEKCEKGLVCVGSTVTVECKEGKKQTYTLVGADEANPIDGKISYLSPIGSALMNLKVGDRATFKTPKEEKVCKVVEIK